MDKFLEDTFPGGKATFQSKKTANGRTSSFSYNYKSDQDPSSPSYTGTKSPNDPFEVTPRVIEEISDENEETSTTGSMS